MIFLVRVAGTGFSQNSPGRAALLTSAPNSRGRMKFPRSRRITRRGDFHRVRTEGKSFSGRFLVLGYLRDETLEEPWKLGLITTKRLGNAVTRNRVRRKLRGIAQRIGERITPGYWLVLVARQNAANATSEQLEKEWKWMLHRNNLMLPKAEPVEESP